jgi:hypothetical protein
LGVKLVDAAAITIRSKMGTVELAAHPGPGPEKKMWVIPSAHNYPADEARIRRLVLGLADLKLVEEKTASPAWHGVLDLIAPKDGGGAIEVEVRDSKGGAIADLLVGKLRPSGPDGRAAVYVRDAHDNQTYLATGDLPVDTERKDWLDGNILNLDLARIKQVQLTPASGQAYTIARETPEAVNFAIIDLPKGRALLSETAANAIGAAASEVALDDVRPQTDVRFSSASRIVFTTFDGLAVTLDVAEQDGMSWVKISAVSTDPKTAAEAQALNAKEGAWAYAVPSWKAELFRKPLESLLKAPEKKEPAKSAK